MWYENFDCHIFFWHRSSYGCNSLGFITARLFSIFLLCTFEFLWWPAFKQLMHGILNVSAGTSELGGLKFFLQQKKNSDFFCVENSVRFAIYKNKGFLFFFLFHLDKNYIMLITNEWTSNIEFPLCFNEYIRLTNQWNFTTLRSDLGLNSDFLIRTHAILWEPLVGKQPTCMLKALLN